jgi:hypothetical protein
MIMVKGVGFSVWRYACTWCADDSYGVNDREGDDLSAAGNVCN